MKLKKIFIVCGQFLWIANLSRPVAYFCDTLTLSKIRSGLFLKPKEFPLAGKHHFNTNTDFYHEFLDKRLLMRMLRGKRLALE